MRVGTFKEQPKKVPSAAYGGFREPTPDTLPRISSHQGIEELKGRVIPAFIPASKVKKQLLEFAKKVAGENASREIVEKIYKVALFSPLMLAQSGEEFSKLLSVYKSPIFEQTKNNIFPGLIKKVLAKDPETTRYVLKQLLLESKTMMLAADGETRKEAATRVMTYSNMLSVAHTGETFDKAIPLKVARELKKTLNIEMGELPRVLGFTMSLAESLLSRELYEEPKKNIIGNELKETVKIEEINELIQQL